MNANNRATLFHHSFSVYRAAVLIIRFPFFPCGAFYKKAPQNNFCGECAFRRRTGAAALFKQIPELSFWFFFFHRKKKNVKK